MNPNNFCKSFTFLGVGQIWMLSTLVVSIWMFPGMMMNPKNVTFCTWNLHFSGLILNFFCFNTFKTIFTCLTCSSLVFEYTKMSSMYVIANLSKYDCNALLTTFCIVVCPECRFPFISLFDPDEIECIT